MATPDQQLDHFELSSDIAIVVLESLLSFCEKLKQLRAPVHGLTITVAAKLAVTPVAAHRNNLTRKEALRSSVAELHEQPLALFVMLLTQPLHCAQKLRCLCYLAMSPFQGVKDCALPTDTYFVSGNTFLNFASGVAATVAGPWQSPFGRHPGTRSLASNELILAARSALTRSRLATYTACSFWSARRSASASLVSSPHNASRPMVSRWRRICRGSVKSSTSKNLARQKWRDHPLRSQREDGKVRRNAVASGA